MEYWKEQKRNDGTMEYWKVQSQWWKVQRSITPILHHSSYPKNYKVFIMVTKWKVPLKNGELFCSIPRSEIPDRMEENRERLNLSSLQIGEMNGDNFKSLLREEMAALLQDELGGKVNLSSSTRVVLSGHQPLLNHSGVWIKLFLLDLIAKESGALAVNLEVDSDTAGPLQFPFPRREKKLKVVWEKWVTGEEGQALESMPAPNEEEWSDFVSCVRSHLETLPHASLLTNLEKSASLGSNALKETGTLSSFFAELRRSYEKPADLNYLSLPLSAVCATRSFHHFFLALAMDAERFVKVYNSALGDYRVRHKLRYKANPFPDLEIRDGSFELPFWWIDKSGLRKRIFVSLESEELSAGKDSFLLIPEGRERFEVNGDNLEKGTALLLEDSIKIRPKALTLTIFSRLFLCDLFIHGIGGAKYDEAADFIIREYYGLTPPYYLAASLTLAPDLGIEKLPDGEAERLQKTLREMQFKPEKFVDLITDSDKREAFVGISREKREFLMGAAKGKKGKEFSQEMNRLNETLFSFLEPTWLETKKKLEEISEKEDEKTAIQFREYPFLMFDPSELKRICEACY